MQQTARNAREEIGPNTFAGGRSHSEVPQAKGFLPVNANLKNSRRVLNPY